ncbi:SDR family NAD(P)-dependent oxidoreductase [Altererythrobacter arenosus]|uniref:SDR family NAD(P)-dependent oxidoreductase n=1 Tax=Altererythrobacter arenosus TaxID=3032592 RepID=A0ABY8FRX7_9SPHN|nr:SDR family oxidoreductase [Altererythrobacter sp. CAU 1644]WFL77760.1 SDR family NAD(P)-dependent oxidoreductase [Altererythrobacter sp. CAU 1644]
MREIAGQGVLITGGGSGLGEATARYLTEREAKVTITGRRADRIAEKAAEIGCNGIAGDVTSAEDRAAMVEAAVDNAGGRLDCLFNNAGNMVRGPVEELDEQELLAIFHANVVGAMMLTGLATPHLAATKGLVLFVGSVHTQRAFPGASPYAATKAAVETLAKVYAAELGDRGIRVNCVIPGSVLTEINVRAGLVSEEEAKARYETLNMIQTIDRLGQGEDIAQAVAYFMESDFTTGTSLTVDGGMGLGVTRGI